MCGISFSSEAADSATIAENGIEAVEALVGRPKPDMYSADLSLFVLDAGIRLVEEDRVRFGHVTDSHRAYLGVEIGDTNGLGVYIQSVTAGGPAGKAGLVVGDVIRSVNGHQTLTVDDLTSIVSELKPGTTVALSIVTQRGSHKTVHLTLGTFPGS